MNVSSSILIIDDDTEIFRLIQSEFQLEGFSLHHQVDGVDGLNHILEQPIALAIVDVNLPGLGGFEICRRARAAKPNLPLLLLTDRSAEADKLIAFERGADDYLTKPFSVRELLARVKAVLRRSMLPEGDIPASSGSRLSAPGLEVELDTRRVFLTGQEITLTRMEFELLLALMERAGKVVERELLSQMVWDSGESFYDPTITSMISRLRKRLQDAGESPIYIETIRGIGYRFIPLVRRNDQP